MSATVYLRPPAPVRPKKSKPKTPAQEIKSALFKYRVQLIPFIGTLWVWLLTLLIGPEWWGPWVLMATAAAIGAALYQDRYAVPQWVPWFRLDRLVERRYALGCAIATGVWALCATWGGTKPELRSTLALLILTCLCAAPWWHHRRIRGSIPVKFQGAMSAQDRRYHLEQARKLVQDWTSFTSAAQIQGAKLRSITYNRWSVAMLVQLRKGATVGEFTVRRLEKLESAFGEVRTGSARVERIERHARLAVIRFMLEDPHAEPIKPPEYDHTNMDEIPLGLFETGDPILFSLVNTLVGGATGSGKSGVINMIIRALARIPTVAILGIDMKPGAPELGKWEPVMHALAKNPAEVDDLLEKLRAGLHYRGDIMSANRWRKWKVTRSQPFIVLIVDEIQEIKKVRGLEKKLDRIVAIIRAYGGCVVLATQYPTAPNVSATIKGNCPQKIGLRTDDPVGDRVIFGESASRTGWRPHLIGMDRQGSFLIRNPIHKRPLLGRAFWMDDDEIDHEAEVWGVTRTMVDEPTWTHVLDPAITAAVASPDGSGRTTVTLTKDADPEADTGEIVDAVIVDDDPGERVLDALSRRTKVADICAETGLGKVTVYKYLNQYKEEGIVISPSRGVWKLSEAPSTDESAA